MQRGDYHGRPVLRLETGHLILDVLEEAGPRIVRAIPLPGTLNQFAETPEVSFETPWGPFELLGGHRLWHAPEAFPRTYVPDGSGLRVTTCDGGLRLTGMPEEPTGIEKAIAIRLEENRAAATITHTLRNTGVWPVELSPWALTQLPHGGVALFPFKAPAKSDYVPNRHLVLWPYSRWRDPRLTLYEDLALLEARPDGEAFKLGYLSHAGWLSYLRGGLLFVKRFTPQPSAVHPDRGCNVESYLDDRFIELETLGPLARLEPGETLEHVEDWTWYTGVEEPSTIEGIRRVVSRLGLATGT
jgi:hypothetical protein